MLTILLQRFGNHVGYGPISVSEARVLTTLFVLALLIAFVFWKYGNVFGIIRDWYRQRTRIPFERLSPAQRAGILENAYCLKCGQIDQLITPKEELLRGEHVISGKCPKCGAIVNIRL